MHRVVAAALLLLLCAPPSLAQEPGSPIQLYPGAPPPSIEPQPLPAIPPAAEPLPTEPAPPTDSSLPGPATPPAASAMSEPAGRVFCQQPVTVRIADRDAIPERYRPFIGIWSDASWTPLLCAALIVENVTPEGTASIVYAFGPMGSPKGSDARGPGGNSGGILHGTGIIRDGALSFQNSDGSQFVFRPLYADLDGHLTTPRGQRFEAIFKKTP